jgi:hypothetical protein
MRRLAAFLAVFMLLAGPVAALCGDHLVAPAAVEERLNGAAGQRAHDVAAVERVLSSPRAVSAAAAIGVRVEGVRAAVPLLSDAELRDLAARAQALGGDPVAGTEAWVNEFLVVFLVVAIVILVISAVD